MKHRSVGMGLAALVMATVVAGCDYGKEIKAAADRADAAASRAEAAARRAEAAAGRVEAAAQKAEEAADKAMATHRRR